MLRSSEDEMSKMLLSVLLAAPRYVLFDNINEADCAALAAVIGSPDCRFAGRILGEHDGSRSRHCVLAGFRK